MKFLTPEYENRILNNSEFTSVVGIDEVGRGCLAGPVAVGAFKYDLNHKFIEGVNDSKKILPKKRERLHQLLSNSTYKVIYDSAENIDSIGIARVIERLIVQLYNEFNSPQTLFLIDGQFTMGFGPNTKKVIKGDATYYSIGAASILAKVERDRLMDRLHDEHSIYNWKQNKGYGTREHIKVIKEFGICNHHRKSFLNNLI